MADSGARSGHEVMAYQYEQINAWLNERMMNSRRIAASKTGADRAGWLEDAEYYRATIRLLADLKNAVTPMSRHGQLAGSSKTQTVEKKRGA